MEKYLEAFMAMVGNASIETGIRGLDGLVVVVRWRRDQEQRLVVGLNVVEALRKAILLEEECQALVP